MSKSSRKQKGRGKKQVSLRCLCKSCPSLFSLSHVEAVKFLSNKMASKSGSKVSSKSGGKTSSQTSASQSKQDPKGKKAVTIADEEEEDDKAGSMAYKILSAEQSKELLGMQILEMQSKLSEIFSLGNYSTDLQHAATLDYYTAAVWWGKQQNFTEAQLSGFFTVIYTLFDNIKEKHMHLVDNLKEYQTLLKGIEPEHPDVKSEGLDFFNVVQAKAVSDYIFQSVFQHYRLYEFMFSHTQAEEIIGTDLEIEVAKPASMPFPPPLDEGAEEELFNTYIATPPPTPAPEEGDGKDTKDEGPEIQDIDAFAELTPQDVQEVIESVTKELLSGLQMDIAAKLREKENNLIQRINKVHKVVEQT